VKNKLKELPAAEEYLSYLYTNYYYYYSAIDVPGNWKGRRRRRRGED